MLIDDLKNSNSDMLAIINEAEVKKNEGDGKK